MRASLLTMISPGSKLGPYEILAPLGAGGMGEVYRARDPRLTRDVAIKVLHADQRADAGRRLRFVQEARAASALNHPNIVTIHEIESADGIDYIVMEYVAGKTLEALIPPQGLRLAEVLRIAIAIADAAARAHSAGILHRDLKPANVVVGSEGVVKILDFGLAKPMVENPGSPEHDTVSEDGAGPLSGPGKIAGTVGYMSPEQAMGQKVDARSDIFSFGAMLYEMATGRRAFAGNSTAETVAAVLREQPKPPSEIVPGVPRDLEKVILRCLQKDLGRRFQHMQDVKIELQEIREESASGPSAAPARRAPRHWLAAGILALILPVVVWRAVTFTRPLPPPRLIQLTSLRGMERNPTFSPDGEQLAFSWKGEKQDNWDIYLKMVDSPDVRRLTNDAAADVSPSWSPDGRLIAYLRVPADRREGGAAPATIHLVSPLGGSDRKLSDFPAAGSPFGVTALSWTPDSRWLAVTRLEAGSNPQPGGIVLVPAQGGEPRELTKPGATGENHVNAAFSPDGRHFSYQSCLAWYQCQLEVRDLGSDFLPSGPARSLTRPDLCYLGNPVWTRDGRSLVYSSCADDMLWRIGIGGDHAPERIEVAGFHAVWPTAAASRDRIAFQREEVGAQDLYRFEAGSPPKPVLASSVTDCCSSLSPDGRRVAFSSGRTTDGGIWLADSDFSSASPLTHGRQGGSPRWSADGRRIAFDSRESDGHYHVWIVEADGGTPRQVTTGAGDEYQPAWSRDGRYVYFSAVREGRRDIWRVPAAGGIEERLTHDGGHLALESVDGKTLFYRSGSIGEERAPLRALPLGGGPERPLADCVAGFDVVGRSVYHFGCGDDDGGRPLYRLDPATGRTQLVARLARATGQLTVSSDGKTILYSRSREAESDLMMIENFR